MFVSYSPRHAPALAAARVIRAAFVYRLCDLSAGLQGTVSQPRWLTA
jgi:hypothetical protein